MSAARPPARRRSGGFRRRDALHNWSLHFGPNMTPMVDVVMVILVFFMASAAFMGPEWFLKSLVPQKPPEGAGAVQTSGPAALTLPPVQLEITLALRDGVTRATGVGKSDAELAQVLDALRAFAQDTPKDKIEVLIRPGAGVPYRDVVRMHEGCERLGLSRVGIATR